MLAKLQIGLPALSLETARGKAREVLEKAEAAGYPVQQILEIARAISVKTLSNYANQLFHMPLAPVFEARRWADRRQDMSSR